MAVLTVRYYGLWRTLDDLYSAGVARVDGGLVPAIGQPKGAIYLRFVHGWMDHRAPLPALFHMDVTADCNLTSAQHISRFFQSLPGDSYRHTYFEQELGDHTWRMGSLDRGVFAAAAKKSIRKYFHQKGIDF